MRNINLGPALKESREKYTETINKMTDKTKHMTATITLKPTCFNHPSGMGRNAKSQLMISQEKINNMISSVSDDYIMVAELTKNGNIHYHAIINFNKLEYGKELFVDAGKNSKIVGFTAITEANDENHFKKFKEYILKDYEKTSNIINKTIKHIDDMINIVSLPSSIKIKKTSNCLRRWLEVSQGDASSASSEPLDQNIIQEYDNTELNRNYN